MKKENQGKIENYFEIFLILFLFFLFFLLMRSFLLPLLLAATLVFLTRKPYNYLVEKTGKKGFSSFFLLFISLVLIFIPLFLIITGIITETSSFVQDSSSLFSEIDLSGCGYEFCSTIESNLAFIESSVDTLIVKASNYLSASIGAIFNSIAISILHLFIFSLAFFFMHKESDKLLRYIRRITPLKSQYKDALFLKFKDVSSAVFVETIFISVLQGIILGTGYHIAGFQSPVLLGALSALFALIPMIGPPLVWVPASIYLFLTGNYAMMGFLLIFGTIVFIFFDNYLRPRLLVKSVQVHPFIILLAIFGGLQAFGVIGLFLGPIIISFLIAVLQLYNVDFS